MLTETINTSAHDTGLPAGSAHAIITSPPYWGLRQYSGEQRVDWQAVTYAPMPGVPAFEVPAMTCALGAEESLVAYIGHLVLCLRDWHRVLRNDGIAFVNLGDSYSGSGGAGGDYNAGGIREGQPKFAGTRNHAGLKPKDLCMVPERFRLAAQADGWYVRSIFPWIKRNGMPGSQQDRPTTSHEDWVMLTKSPRYFWDQEAVKMPAVTVGDERHLRTNRRKESEPMCIDKGSRAKTGNPTGEYRYRRTADWTFDSLDIAIAKARQWADQAEAALNAQSLILDEAGDPLCMPVNPRPYTKAHYAVFPEPMIEPLIKGATSAYGCCPKCGSPWRRVVEREGADMEARYARGEAKRHGANGASASGANFSVWDYSGRTETTGWEPTCGCGSADIQDDDLEIMHTPTGERSGEDPSVTVGRAGPSRPRGNDEGTRPMTRYEQRKYADQIKQSPYWKELAESAGSAIAHYIRKDRSGARPVPEKLLEEWIANTWIERVALPAHKSLDPIPCTVLDPFAGSGTTLKVAVSLGRRAIGIDISKQYLEEHVAERVSGVQIGLAF